MRLPTRRSGDGQALPVAAPAHGFDQVVGEAGVGRLTRPRAQHGVCDATDLEDGSALASDGEHLVMPECHAQVTAV